MSNDSKRRCVAEDPSVTLFREYLRIKTVQPDPDYDGAMEFLQRIANDIGLEFLRLELVPKKPAAILTWKGQDSSLPSVLLNSHIDVVPVFPEHWKYPPFDAYKDENGDIYARGAQDMKCVGIQYVEAIRKLKSEGKTFKRTIHLSFVPDEEIGGRDGMRIIVKSQEFKKLNVGFALDEGLAVPTDVLPVFYGERSTFWVKFRCTGDPGHGSRFLENNCAEKVRRLMNRILEFRAQEKARLEDNKDLTLGDVVTANITMLEGGVQFNVIPAEMSIGVDIRIDPHRNLEEFTKQIENWAADAGEGITATFVLREESRNLTSISANDPWWNAFSKACERQNLRIEPEVFPAATDSRFLRSLGIPALGFSPMAKTPQLLHDHNEFLNERTFLKGIEIYEEIIPSLANVPKLI